MLTDCSVKCLGACTRRAFGDARRCQRVSQRWNRYHPYFITGEAVAAGEYDLIQGEVYAVLGDPCSMLEIWTGGAESNLARFGAGD